MKRLALFLFFALALVFSAPVSATVSSTASQSIQYGTGSQNLWYVSFPVVSASDVSVIYTDANGSQTTLTPTQYLVTIYPASTGQIWSYSASITYPLIGAPIAAGTSLTISRNIPLTQTTTLSNQGAFYPKVVESALDTNLMQLQQVSARTGLIRGSWLTGATYNFGDIVVDGPNGGNTGNLYVCALSHTSTTWTADLSAGDWSLALNVQSIINASPDISNNQVYGNISGISAAPYGVGVSALLDSYFGTTQGAILYRGGSTWNALSPGTNGYFLETQGAAANPTWVAAGGGLGTITGVSAGTGLTGGGTSGSVTLSLGTIADKSLLANTTGSTNSPSAITLSAYLDDVFGSSQGEILYRAGTLWVALAPGTAGQFLQTAGALANPSWSGTAITQSAADSSTKIATTAFVNGTALTLANGTTATTQSSGNSSTEVATTAFVHAVATSGFSSCTQVSTSGSTNINVSCAGGYTMTGGGCNPYSSGSVNASYPSDSSTWTCSAVGLIYAYAICCH